MPKSVVPSCWSSQEFLVLHHRLWFLQHDWRLQNCPSKAINVNEARGIGQMSPDPILSGGLWARNYTKGSYVTSAPLTTSTAGLLSMFTNGCRMSTFCRQRKTAVVCITMAPSVLCCRGCLGSTLIWARVPPCSLATNDLAIHCI